MTPENVTARADAILTLLGFNDAEWAVELRNYARPMIQRLVLGGMLDAAATRGFSASKASSASQWLQEQGVAAPAWLTTELPEHIRDAVVRVSEELMEQPWWNSMVATLRTELSEIIAGGIIDGKTFRQIADEIEAKSGEIAGKRAKLIAATETSAALNAGRMESMRQVAKKTGFLLAKEWLSTLDEVTRDTHAEADGQIVPIDAPFDVGGYDAQYPGDPALPVQERAKCRCTQISATIDEAVGAPLPDMTVDDVPEVPEVSEPGAIEDSGDRTSRAYSPRSSWQPAENMEDLAKRLNEVGIAKVATEGVRDALAVANTIASEVTRIIERFPGVGTVLERKPVRLIIEPMHSRAPAGYGSQGGADTIWVESLASHAPGGAPQGVGVAPAYRLGGYAVDDGVLGALRNAIGRHLDRSLPVNYNRQGRWLDADVGPGRPIPKGDKRGPRRALWIRALADSGDPRAWLSERGAASPTEAFAEAFSAITRHDYGRSGKPRLPGGVERFFAARVLGADDANLLEG